MDNTFGAVWEASKLPEPPMDVRMVNSILQTVVIKNAVVTAGFTGDVETTAQFPVPNAETTVTAAAAPTVIVGQAIKAVPDTHAANSTSTANASLADATAANAVPRAGSAAASATAVAAGLGSSAAVASSSAAVVPAAAGAAQDGAPNPSTTAGADQKTAASDDFLPIEAQPAASTATAHTAAAVGGRKMLLAHDWV